MALLARIVIRLSTWLAPRDLRARWREEWLAELSNFEVRTSKFELLQRALGAPIDALALRRAAASSARRRRFHSDQWMTDLRYTVRLLARSPGYVGIVVLGLSAGLTVTIAMFSTINAALHGEIPGVVDRDSLVRVRLVLPQADKNRSRLFTVDTFPVIRRHGPLIEDVAAQARIKTTVRVNDESISLRGALASDTLFQMLGTRPVAGRLLGPTDNRPDADVIVIGYRLWQRHFGGRLDAIGQTMGVGDRTMRIVGVAPDQFSGLWSGPIVQPQSVFGPPEFWLPLAVAREWRGSEGTDNPLGSYLEVAARLAPGARRTQADGEFAAAARALESLDPAAGPAIIRVQAFVLGAIADDALAMTGAWSALLAMPLALLAIGCANVANLRLAKATARSLEIAVRMSLGATRGQVTRLLLIESTILTALAVIVSGAAARVLIVLFGSSFVALPIGIDWRVMAFAAGLAAVVVFVSGLAPGWLVTARATAQGMKQSAQAGGLAHSRLRHTLVIVQVAISLALLAVGSLLVRSLVAVNQTRPAALDRLLVASLDFGSVGHDATRAKRIAADLLDRVAADPRFAGAGLAEFDLYRQPEVRLTPAAVAPVAKHSTVFNRVTPGWFDAMQLRPIAGRIWRVTDRDVAVVNESAARALAVTGSPVGMRVSIAGYERPSQTVDVIGVVPDFLRDPRRPLEPQPFIYLPLIDGMPETLSPTLYAREGSAVELSRELAGLIGRAGTPAPWARVERGSDMFAAQTDDIRGLARTVSALAIVALALAAAGLFAVMAYTVSLRTREIGIRMALGARREDVTRLVLRQALRLATIGAVIGFGIALLIAVPLNRALLGVSPFDPLALVPVALLLVATALAAGLLPARRAAAVNPVTALRAE